MHRAGRLAPALVLSACHSQGGVLLLPWFPDPAARDATSVVLALEGQSEVSAEAHLLSGSRESFELRLSDSMHADWNKGAPLRLTAFLFKPNLETLGLAEGTLPSRSSGEGATQRLVDADATVVQSVRDGSAMSPWATGATRSDLLASIRIPASAISPCHSFSPKVVELSPDLGSYRIALAPLSADAALVELELKEAKEFRYLRVDASGVATMLDPPVPARAHYAGFLRSDGTLWMGGDGGVVDGFRLEAQRLVVTASVTMPVGHRDAISQVDGPPEGPLELLALDVHGVLSRFDGAEWRELWRDPGGRLEFKERVAWVGTGEALAARGDGYLVHVRNGTVAIEQPGVVGAAAQASFQGVGLIPAVGAVSSGYSSAGGYFARFDPVGGAWSLLAQPSPAVYQADSFAPTERGFIFGGENQQIGEFTGPDQLCTPIKLGSVGSWGQIVPIGGGRFVLGGGTLSRRPAVLLLSEM
jgi:hypothetical protein